MSIREIAERNLLPIGQFYLRIFENMTKSKVEHFRTSAAELLQELKIAAESGIVPYYTALDMQETIRKIMDNVIAKSDGEVEVDMTTNITETLEWVDYKKVFEELEERSREEGIEQGIEQGIEIGSTVVTAKKMLAKSYTIEQIVDVTGLSVEDVQDLRKDLVPNKEAT